MNKTRPNKVYFRVSNNELLLLKQLVKQSGGTQQDYILSLLFPTGSEEKKEVKPSVPECPKCGANMRLKTGKFGKFWSCIEYPNCNGTRNWSDK